MTGHGWFVHDESSAILLLNSELVLEGMYMYMHAEVCKSHWLVIYALAHAVTMVHDASQS